MSRERLLVLLEITALLAILALAGYLRLMNIETTPGWYSDEGTHLEIARNLVEGETRYFALRDSTLLVARLPLFEYALAGWMRLFGVDMNALRGFTGTLGVVSVALLYMVVRPMANRRLALLSAGMLAIYPQAVLYSRFGFSYNLLTPFVLATIFSLHRYQTALTMRKRWLILAALCIGIGGTSDMLMFTFSAPFIIVVAVKRWRDLRWSVPLIAAPLLIYAAAMLLTAPNAFLFDLRYTFSRLNTLSPIEQIANVALNYTTLISQDFWMLAGVIGLFLLRPTRLRWLALLLFFVPLVSLGRTVALHSLSAYYMIPLLPFVTLGTTALVLRGTGYLVGMIRAALRPYPSAIGWLASAAVTALIVAAPLLTTLALTIDKVQSGSYPTAIDSFTVNPQDARNAAAFVNAHTNADDLVIVSPAIGWLIEAHAADFQMSAAAQGQSTPHLPANVPPQRWAFDPRSVNTRYVIVDNLWRNWGAVHIPSTNDLLQEVETWPVVFQSGAVVVYENPDRE